MKLEEAKCIFIQTIHRKKNPKRRKDLMKRRQKLFIYSIICFVGIVVSSFAAAQEVSRTKSGAATEKGYDDWHFLFYLPGWIAGLEGDVTASGTKADVHVSIEQSLENLKQLESMALGHFEVKKGPWGLLVEGIYMKLGDEVNAARKIKLPILVPVEIPVSGRIEVFSEMSFDEAALLYDLYRSPSSIGNRAILTVEALGGARYTYLRTKIEATIAGPLGTTRRTLQGKRDWVDPILGGRLSWNLSDRCMLGFRADVGGFGISSDIALNLDAMLKYRITKQLNLYSGFRALYMDHEEGSGSSKFKYDVWAYGPWMGLGVEF
jgi:hypothetical protein